MKEDQKLKELVVKAQSGDQHAYQDFLEEVSHFIKKRLIQKIYDKQFIDDVLQEILLAVHKALPTYDKKQSFSPWLGAIVHYKVVDHIRRCSKKIEEKELPAVIADEKKNVSFKLELWKEIYSSLDELAQIDSVQSEIVKLAKLEGLSIEEISKKMEMSSSYVKVSIHRGLKKLKHIMEKNHEH